MVDATKLPKPTNSIVMMRTFNHEWMNVRILFGPVFQDGKYWYEVHDEAAKERYGYAIVNLSFPMGYWDCYDIQESIKGYMVMEGQE